MSALVPGNSSKNSSPPQWARLSEARLLADASAANAPRTASPEGMAMGVVDTLEMVNVQEHQAHRLDSALVAQQFTYQQLRQEAPVDQTRQFVMGDEPLHLGQHADQVGALLMQLAANGRQARRQP